MHPRTWLVGALLVAMMGAAEPILLDPFLAGTLIAAGGAAALLGAAKIGAGAVGAGVIGAGAAIGAAKLGAVGAGAFKVAKVKAVGAGTLGAVGAAKLGAAAKAKAVGAAKLGTVVKAKAVGVGAIKAVGAAKLGPVVKAKAVGIGAIGAIGAAKLGTVAAGVKKVGLIKTGLASGQNTRVTTRVTYSGNNDSGERYGRSSSSSSSSHRRYRREIGGYTNAQEMLLQSAYTLDKENPCGLRLVCELATKDAYELEADELLIMDMLNQPHSLSSMAVPYDEAAHLGSTTSSPVVCAEVYHRCKLDRNAIMGALRSQHKA